MFCRRGYICIAIRLITENVWTVNGFVLPAWLCNEIKNVVLNYNEVKLRYTIMQKFKSQDRTLDVDIGYSFCFFMIFFLSPNI